MKKIIGIIAIVALIAIAGIGSSYFFSHQNDGITTRTPDTTTTSTAATVTEDEAKAIALEDAQLAEADVTFTKIQLERDDGRQKYEIDFVSATDSTRYDYEIDAETGSILSIDREYSDGTGSTSMPQAEGEITADEAKAIALQDANVAEADVLYIDVDYDRDDGISEWNVEFATSTTEYDYEINAATSAILKSETEPHNR